MTESEYSPLSCPWGDRDRCAISHAQRDDAQNSNLSPQPKRNNAIVGRTPRIQCPAIVLLYILLFNTVNVSHQTAITESDIASPTDGVCCRTHNLELQLKHPDTGPTRHEQ